MSRGDRDDVGHNAAMDIASPEIEAYAEAHTTPMVELLRELTAETHATLPVPQMLTDVVAARLLELLVYASGARRVLEIGTFSGFSALSMAAGLPHDGRIDTCEIDPVHAEVARRYIARSPYASRIVVHLGPALETIAALEGDFDFVFIDADKPNYANYLDAVLPRLSPHGLIAVDNTLWSGRVAEPEQDEMTRMMAAFNDRVAGDPSLVSVILTVRDGITVIRRA